MITLKLNDIVQIDGCLYKIAESQWRNKSSWNDKDGKGSGFKLILKKLTKEELMELIIKNENKNNK